MQVFTLQFLAIAALAVLVGLPLLTLLHELGHAFVAAVLIGSRVTVIQGPAPPRLQLSLGRLDLRLHWPVGPHQVWVGWALWGDHRDRWRHAAATAAGPATSAGCSALCGLGASRLGGASGLFLTFLSVGAGCQLLSTGLPVRYGRYFGGYAGEPSDALRVRRLLAGPGKPDPLPAHLAWHGGRGEPAGAAAPGAPVPAGTAPTEPGPPG